MRLERLSAASRDCLGATCGGIVDSKTFWDNDKNLAEATGLRDSLFPDVLGLPEREVDDCTVDLRRNGQC